MKLIYVNNGVKNYMKVDQLFCRLSFRNCKSCVYECDDLLSYKTYTGTYLKLTLFIFLAALQPKQKQQLHRLTHKFR